MTMKQIDRITQLEEQQTDMDTQLKQLRKEMAQLQQAIGVRMKEELTSKQETKRQEDMAFAHAVRDALKTHNKHSFIVDRDVFTTRHMHIIITGCVDKALHNLEMDAVHTGWNGPEFHQLNAELRTMTTRLVNSGLFMRRKTQQYVPVNPHDIHAKPSTTKSTVIISDRFHRYGGMTDSKLGTVMKTQYDNAMALFQQRRKEQEEKEAKELAEMEQITQSMDTEVSFL